jgi:toxin-antitoxin system PIN domain toxin
LLAVDTNVLVYAFFNDSPFHESAQNVLTQLADSPAAWAIPWSCIHEFYSVVTHPKTFGVPGITERAQLQIATWLKSPSLQMLGETSAHWSTLQRLLSAGDVAGPVVHDARIAALCISHGVTELITLDRDFSRFPELTVRRLTVNPA